MTDDLLRHETWDEPAWEDPAPGRRRWPFVVGGVLALAAVLYGATAAWAGDRVARGTTVAGVDVGGQDAAAARATLDRRLGGAAQERLTLTSPAGEAALTPADAGLSVDVPATVEGLVGFSLSPADLWRHVAGGGERPAVVRVDDAAFGRAVEDVRDELDAKAVEGRVSISGGKVAHKAPVPGVETDVARTAAAVRRAWPGSNTVAVVGDVRAPKVAARELERVRDEFARVAVSGPVTVRVGEKSFELSARQLAPAAVLTPAEDGTITPRADDAKLRRIVHEAAQEAKVEVEPKDAVVTFAGNDWRRPRVRDSVPGSELDDASISAAVWTAFSTASRTATVTTKEVQPDFTTAVARKTLPKEKVSSFTTYFEAGAPRVTNIKNAARLIDGTYVPPGEQFSMNGVLGERTPDKGYVKAGIILNNRLSESYGGGISQVSTTIFNASFFAGVRLDAWQAHSFYISRYPEGREATISWPDLHNKFTNTLDGGILMDVSTTDTSITVTYWGTKKYDVEATKSARYDIVQPKVVRDDSPTCKPQSPVPGFKVDIGRIFKEKGKVVRTASFTTSYVPEDDVTCTGTTS
ncbi:VanW family protein [Phycicoccus sp. MAQZ13P-2]|uniref:VanW family protein n=1 Tax=Phycicoccus mangrovi TaxID=2840470 RepID=UPI001C0063E1|nr:VanW family protein [Phycicoccus mangrovi]MBT9254009.1 VanW family protein [Phycicoccus mangrovi]MBT9275578.1 VanW family protein [Phycicoccus mangrovi]